MQLLRLAISSNMTKADLFSEPLSGKNVVHNREKMNGDQQIMYVATTTAVNLTTKNKNLYYYLLPKLSLSSFLSSTNAP